MNAPTPPASFADVVNLWASAEELADDLGENGGTVRQWRNRDSIPAEKYMAVVAAAAERATKDAKFKAVTVELLASIAAKPRAVQSDASSKEAAE